ncbi:hypothetical protein [Kangiella sp. TOML190]|uniref:hypothetical protein n=1 Tax=Kangiella sp. TOML190 TaxID=2931351 RepID=UPI00203CC1C9|nr:hypothetical protein [Kangiella sp. TOML190]
MENSKGDALKLKLSLPPELAEKELQAFVFSTGGKPLGNAKVSDNCEANIKLAKNVDGRNLKLVIAPALEKDQATPSLKQLQRFGAYGADSRFIAERPEIELKIPRDFILPLLCFCNVKGKVINRVSLPDGTVQDAPVCNARVHICEVDPWYLILPKIPDRDIFRLKEDLLEKLYPVRRPKIPDPFPDPIPDPRPDPIPPEFELRRDLSLDSAAVSGVANRTFDNSARGLSEARMAISNDQFAFEALANANDAMAIRRQLLNLNRYLYPYWCWFRYLWPLYRKDCIKTVEVDHQGHFSTTIFYNCNDHPDLYFWVEQLQDGVWQTVYKPNVACNTYWNYECGSEVVINAPNAEPCETPEYDIPDGVTLFVLPYKIGHTPIFGNPSGVTPPIGWLKPDGFLDYNNSALGTLYNAPFAHVLHFFHDDSYFIPKGDTDPGSDDNSIKYYRYSYRRVGTSGWTAMTAPQNRRYRMEYDDGSLPTYETYPIPPQTVGSESNLFEFKPRTPPPRATDPATVVVREWLTGNLNDVAASWDTRGVAPPMSSTNLTDDAGTFEVQIEVFNAVGQKIMPGADTFEFLMRDSTDPTLSRRAEAAEVVAGGLVFKVHVDNNLVSSALPQPSIGGVSASDDCGFLRYDSPSTAVHIEYQAEHPNNHAVFDFTIIRGSNVLGLASTSSPYVETAAVAAPPYTKVGSTYQNDFSASDLVGSCINAAFAADLDVWGKATNGYKRLGIDSHRLIAFALAENSA